MKKHLLISIIFLNLFIVSCTFNSNEIIQISEIEVYDTTKENEKIGNDLLTYDYSNMIVNELNIKDNEVLKNITWQYWIPNGSKKVLFRLILNNKAKEYKSKLVPFFEKFVNEKLTLYKERKDYFNEIISNSDKYIDRIRKEEYDSLWSQVSPKFAKMTNKEEFIKVLIESKTQFKPIGEKTISNRQVYSELGQDLKGEYYVINYEYSNKVYEQVSLERKNDSIKVVGYRNFFPNK